MMTELLMLFIKIFILMGVGYFFAKKNVITPEMKKQLSGVMVNVVLYFSILSSSQQELNDAYLKGFFITLAVISVYYVLSLWGLRRLSRHFAVPETEKCAFVAMAVFANVAFVGFPIIGELIGEEGTLYTVAVNASWQLFFFSYGVYLLSSGSGEPKKLELKSLLKSGMLMVSLVSIFLYLMPFRLPEVVQSTFSMVGSMMTPLSMFVIGAEIAGMELQKVLKDKYSYLISFLRLVFFPLVMLVAVKLLNLAENVGLTLVVLSAMPSGTINVIMAQEYNCEPEFAARSVAQSMLLMVATLPVIMVIAKLAYAG